MKHPYQTKPLPKLTIKELDERVRRKASEARAWSIFAIVAAAVSVTLLVINVLLGGPCGQ